MIKYSSDYHKVLQILRPNSCKGIFSVLYDGTTKSYSKSEIIGTKSVMFVRFLHYSHINCLVGNVNVKSNWLMHQHASCEFEVYVRIWYLKKTLSTSGLQFDRPLKANSLSANSQLTCLISCTQSLRILICKAEINPIITASYSVQ